MLTSDPNLWVGSNFTHGGHNKSTRNTCRGSRPGKQRRKSAGSTALSTCIREKEGEMRDKRTLTKPLEILPLKSAPFSGMAALQGSEDIPESS